MVYKRDFALGGMLALADAVRHIAQPALRQIVQAEVRVDKLHVGNSPFPHRDHAGTCCQFLGGMFGGLLANMHGDDRVQVVQTHCRNTGSETCCFEFHA